MFSWIRVAAVGLAMAGATIATGAAQAQSITFTGTAAGCFGATCTPGTTATTQGLTYNGSSFSVTTVDGFTTIGNLPGTPNVNNLGSFTLAGTAGNYGGEIFKLAVTFTAPAGTSPSTGNYSGLLTGRVVSATNGGVLVAFASPTLNFAFPGGTFTLTVNNVSVTAGSTIAASGTIVAVPGPIAGAGLPVLLGLAGLALYRRRSASTAA